MHYSMPEQEVLVIMTNAVLIPKEHFIQKLVTYTIPENHQKLRNALFEAGAGKIGNYENCSFNSRGIGTYLGNENSNPEIGNKFEFIENKTVKYCLFRNTFLLKRWSRRNKCIAV